MQATPSTDDQPALAATTSVKGRLITDAPTRMFHCLFAISFLGAYLTSDSERWRLLHVTLGYTMAGLLTFRVLYGLFGPRQASLGAMWRKVAGAPAWLRSCLAGNITQGGINWRQGQNLAMALAVVSMLMLTLPLTLSGYALFNEWGDAIGDGEWLEELHEFFGNAFLVLVLAHLGFILGLSILRRRNHALPMLTGRADGKGPDLVRHNRSWLAILMLAAVMGFVAWAWQQSPKGLLPSSTSSTERGEMLNAGSHEHDNDEDD